MWMWIANVFHRQWKRLEKDFQYSLSLQRHTPGIKNVVDFIRKWDSLNFFSLPFIEFSTIMHQFHVYKSMFIIAIKVWASLFNPGGRWICSWSFSLETEGNHFQKLRTNISQISLAKMGCISFTEPKYTKGWFTYYSMFLKTFNYNIDCILFFSCVDI